jgi:hypothetical protein
MVKTYVQDNLKYDYRVMDQFVRFLKKNDVYFTYYKKHKRVIIDDGFKTVFEIQEKGIWKSWRIDKQVEMTEFIFILHVNSMTDLLCKAVRFKLIPYQKLAKYKL